MLFQNQDPNKKIEDLRVQGHGIGRRAQETPQNAPVQVAVTQGTQIQRHTANSIMTTEVIIEDENER